MRRITASILCVFCLCLICSSCAVTQPASKYAYEENWAYYGIGEDKNADVFLISPTCTFDAEGYNMDMNDETIRERTVGSLNMERGIYEESCRLFAPFYSQATIETYTMDEAQAEKYFEIAYADVEEAFLYYMENENDGRPLVLAGFSQGAQMALMLMERLYDNDEYADNLVAAYIIGWRITEDDLREYPHLVMAQEETDTGVIISFNSEAEDVNTSLIVPDKTVGINPLNWMTDSTPADESLNLGACFTGYDGTIIKEENAFCGAYLDDERGTLKVTGIIAEEYSTIPEYFADGVYHIYDYQFFYRNLQQNVNKRVETFLSERNAQ